MITVLLCTAMSLDAGAADPMAKPIKKLRGKRTPKSIIRELGRALKKCKKVQ